MIYGPAIPFGGYGGFAFLERTRERQQDVMEAMPAMERDTRAFAERIAGVTSAAELVADRQLLKVALGAFGLDEDINNRFLIEKILESDTSDRNSMASKFADRRYKALADAFGFGNAGGARTGEAGFAERIVARYTDRQFEIAAGEVDQDMRLALGFARDLAEIAAGEGSPRSKWFTLMSMPPLRSVMETALGLPKSFGQLDLDRQLDEFRSRAEARFGTSDLGELAGGETAKEVVRTFLVMAEIGRVSAESLSRGSAALALLQG